MIDESQNNSYQQPFQMVVDKLKLFSFIKNIYIYSLISNIFCTDLQSTVVRCTCNRGMYMDCWALLCSAAMRTRSQHLHFSGLLWIHRIVTKKTLAQCLFSKVRLGLIQVSRKCGISATGFGQESHFQWKVIFLSI